MIHDVAVVDRAVIALSRIGPGSPSALSSAPPVMPGISRLQMTSCRSDQVTIRPTSVTSIACHSPAGWAAFSFGARKP